MTRRFQIRTIKKDAPARFTIVDDCDAEFCAPEFPRCGSCIAMRGGLIAALILLAIICWGEIAERFQLLGASALQNLHKVVGRGMPV